MASVEDAPASETELKFEVASSVLSKLRKHPVLAGPGGKSRLRSVYFDTPDYDLRNAGVSLRVRESGGHFVQTVKTRSAPGSIERREWETAVAADRPDQRTLASTPAGDVLNGSDADALAPVFVTTVDRAIRLWEGGGAVVEVAFDEGEIKAGHDREAIRELELELKAGEPAALFALAHEIVKTAPILLTFDTKAERGYRLAGHDQAAALKAEQPAAGPKTTTAEAFRMVARNCLTQISGNAQLLRRMRSPQALHQARVGLRRLRAMLSAFKPLVSDGRFEWVKAEAKWLAREFDQARDLDVFTQAAVKPDEDSLHDDPAMAVFHRKLLAAQVSAYERAGAALDSRRFAEFLLVVAEWIEVGDWTRNPALVELREQPLATFAGPVLDRMRKKVRKAGRGFRDLDVAGRHRLRIQGKKLRYATDLFAPAFPDHPKLRAKFLSGLKTLQDRLGELNDLAVSNRIAREVVGRRSAEAAFAAGMVIGRRSLDEPDLLDEAGKALDHFKAARPFWEQPAATS